MPWLHRFCSTGALPRHQVRLAQRCLARRETSAEWGRLTGWVALVVSAPVRRIGGISRAPPGEAAAASGRLRQQHGEAAQVEGEALEVEFDGVGGEREVAHLPVAVAALERAECALHRR